MYKYKDQKEMRTALNGKMITQLVGIFLIFTAISSSVLLGMNCIALYRNVLAGQADALESMATLEEAGLTSTSILIAGIVSLIRAIGEMFVGVYCFKCANRLDMAQLTFKVAIGLLIWELVFGAALLFLGVATISGLLQPILLCIFLFWSSSSLKKIRKAYPDRQFAIDPNNNQRGRDGRRPQEAPKPKKSIRERSMMTADDEKKETLEKIETESVDVLEEKAEASKDAEGSEDVVDAEFSEIEEVPETEEVPEEK